MRFKLNRHVLVLAVSASVLLSGCGGVKTTSTGGNGDYPTGNIQMSVGASPGGSTDLITRAIAEGVGKELGVSVPVVNKPGANGW
jgi:tripartite-type tricarboxylate transporter receptor subunit TctC